MCRPSKGALAKIAVMVSMTSALLWAGDSPGAWAARPPALVSTSRCAANEAAGTITYLTGFEWEASVGILDPIAAEAQGFYRAMCLTVKLVPGNGDPTSSGQLVAAGKATVTELGSPYDAIDDVAGTPSIPVDAIAIYGNTTIDTLLTMPSVTNLRQLDGKTHRLQGGHAPGHNRHARTGGRGPGVGERGRRRLRPDYLAPGPGAGPHGVQVERAGRAQRRRLQGPRVGPGQLSGCRAPSTFST